jgi:hypothetical protein
MCNQYVGSMIVKNSQIVSRISQSLQINYIFASPVVVFTRNIVVKYTLCHYPPPLPPLRAIVQFERKLSIYQYWDWTHLVPGLTHDPWSYPATLLLPPDLQNNSIALEQPTCWMRRSNVLPWCT